MDNIPNGTFFETQTLLIQPMSAVYAYACVLRRSIYNLHTWQKPFLYKHIAYIKTNYLLHVNNYIGLA